MVVENMSVPRDRRVWQEALALRKAGVSVSVVSPMVGDENAARETLEGIEIHRHPLTPSAGGARGYAREYADALRSEFRLAREIHRTRPFQAVHASNPPDLLFLIGLYFRARHGASLIFDHHDLAPELFEVKFGRRGPFHRALLAAERRSLRSADVVIVPNESYREIALERGGVPGERVFVVRNGPDLETFRRSERGTDSRRDRRYLIGYVGVLGEQDGVDVLLRALKKLRDERYGSDVHLMVIGDGPHAAALRGEAKRLGIGAQVEFTGWLSGAELTDRVGACDVCACPDPVNAFSDRSSMIKVAEYMALGRPVVQFDTTEGRRTAGAAALYARPGDEADFADKLATLIESPELRERLARAGRERVESSLAWSRQVPNLVRAYEAAGRAYMARRRG